MKTWTPQGHKILGRPTGKPEEPLFYWQWPLLLLYKERRVLKNTLLRNPWMDCQIAKPSKFRNL